MLYRGETEDLGRFHIDFDFPSPTAAPVEDLIDEPTGDIDGFELSAGDIQPLADPPSTDTDTGGELADFIGLSFQQPASRSQSPGIVGGGLRDDVLPLQGKAKRLSKYGIAVPNLPTGVVKKLATRFVRRKAGSKTKLNKDAISAIEQATSWFFEQASNDLAGYSKHAQRKTIDESDVTMLMRRLAPFDHRPSRNAHAKSRLDNVISTIQQQYSPWHRSICPKSFNKI